VTEAPGREDAHKGIYLGEQFYPLRGIVTSEHSEYFTKLEERDEPPVCIVLHWTAGEGHASTTKATLDRRDLSVDFVIDRVGTVWQMNPNPLKYKTQHAGWMNERSIGVEITNFGYRKELSDVPRKGRDRSHTLSYVQGRRLKLADFYFAQERAVKALCDVICYACGIPRQVLREKDGVMCTSKALNASLKEFSGVVGHYAVSSRKIDPGTALMYSLIEYGY